LDAGEADPWNKELEMGGSESMAMAMEICTVFPIEASRMEGLSFVLSGVGVGIEGWPDERSTETRRG
jgi:hypothetical protein